MWESFLKAFYQIIYEIITKKNLNYLIEENFKNKISIKADSYIIFSIKADSFKMIKMI